jgi:hypothetical protein
MKVRIAICISESGEWFAWGRSDCTDDDNAAEVEGQVGEPNCVHYIECEVPVPVPQTFQGEIADARDAVAELDAGGGKRLEDVRASVSVEAILARLKQLGYVVVIEMPSCDSQPMAQPYVILQRFVDHSLAHAWDDYGSTLLEALQAAERWANAGPEKFVEKEQKP